ncbi:urease accessory protein UreE [Pontibacter kalidii]|uniref:urease accessory protein UreE n=1 Tax=Pontibacter kalidii TaxID=2592049 RepID=UPI0022510EAC|nr:urease accessory protein UreE [Pontibacter kalidii]
MLNKQIEVTHALGNGLDVGQRTVDVLEVEWHETPKSRMRRKTKAGREVLINRRDRGTFQDGDTLYLSDELVVILRIRPCDCIVLRPTTLQEVGTVCFEIGNKHVPIFMTEQEEVCVAYDGYLYQMLLSNGFAPAIEERVLCPYQMVKAYGNVV